MKQLACQFIVRFYKKFPALESEAIDAQLDLCEDDDQSVRYFVYYACFTNLLELFFKIFLRI